jgi:hypothetical protein
VSRVSFDKGEAGSSTTLSVFGFTSDAEAGAPPATGAITASLAPFARACTTSGMLAKVPGPSRSRISAVLVINRQSTQVIAVDPGFFNILPQPGTYSFSDTVSEIRVPEAQPGTRNILLLRPADGVDPIG